MKLLFCENCGDLVSPEGKGGIRWCSCGYSCCWWDDPLNGKFAVFSKLGESGCSIVGINNSLLVEPFKTYLEDGKQVEFGIIPKDAIDRLIENTPETYLFKRVRSLIIRIRPGYSNDTRFAPLEEVQSKS